MSLAQDSRAAYEAAEGINYSILKLYARSPAHARQEMLHPKAPTKAMDTGQGLHVCTLEPGRFDREYVVPPKVDRRTKIGKATWAQFEAENKGKVLLRADEYEAVRRMSDSLRAHPVIAPLLAAEGMNEASVYWTDPETGLKCKCRIDRLALSTVIDLKQTQDARPGPFASQVAKLGYHIQSDFYLTGLDHAAPHPRRWLWGCVEPEPPWAARVYEPSEQTLAQGREEWETYLKQHQECLRTNKWPSYPTQPTSLNLPTWAIRAPEIQLL